MMFLFFQWPAMRVRQPLEGMKRPNPGEPVEYIIQNTEKWRDAVFEPSQTPRWFSVFSSVQGSGQNYPWLSMFHTLSTKKTIVICCFFWGIYKLYYPVILGLRSHFFRIPKKKPIRISMAKTKKSRLLTLRTGNVAWTPWNTCRVWCLVVAAMYLGCRKQQKYGATNGWVLEQLFFHEFLNRMKVLSWINLHYWCVASVLADRTTTKKNCRPVLFMGWSDGFCLVK